VEEVKRINEGQGVLKGKNTACGDDGTPITIKFIHENIEKRI